MKRAIFSIVVSAAILMAGCFCAGSEEKDGREKMCDNSIMINK